MWKRIASLAATIVILGACGETQPLAPSDNIPNAPSNGHATVIEVKFRADAAVRTDAAGRLRSGGGNGPAVLREELDHAGVVSAYALFEAIPGERLEALEEAARARSRRPIPDLRSWHRLTLAPGADVEAALRTLRALPEVEEAHLAPRMALPPATPDFSSFQTYFSAAPAGTDAAYARTLPGGRGAGVTVVDMEFAWSFTNEDIPVGFSHLISGNMAPDAVVPGYGVVGTFYANHGDAVLGQLVGRDNGLGVTGGVPDAWALLATPLFFFVYSPALSIVNTAAQLRPGDVILLEMQAGSSPGPFAPVEVDPSVYDAIRIATQAGIVVVEPAANGSTNLDPPSFGGRFDRGRFDSGAIMVGGGTSTLYRSSASQTNWGGRVDVQGRGEGVTTTGYGDLYNTGNTYAAYTRSFAGTSSASPIVAAAVVSIQGYLKATGRRPLTSLEMRDLLVSTGTPEANPAVKVGPLPNLRAAVARVDQLYPIP